MPAAITERSNRTKPEGSSLDAWVVVVIAIGVIVLLVILGGLTFLAVHRIRERRRNHGEYRPQLEENNARDLPVIPPPSIEGLI